MFGYRLQQTSQVMTSSLPQSSHGRKLKKAENGKVQDKSPDILRAISSCAMNQSTLSSCWFLPLGRKKEQSQAYKDPIIFEQGAYMGWGWSPKRKRKIIADRPSPKPNVMQLVLKRYLSVAFLINAV